MEYLSVPMRCRMNAIALLFVRRQEGCHIIEGGARHPTIFQPPGGNPGCKGLFWIDLHFEKGGTFLAEQVGNFLFDAEVLRNSGISQSVGLRQQ